MAEKRKLLNEIDKCFKKVEEGVELFEETMAKMQEANSDNQREKFQDDLKKEIKKLQRLRDQIKGWQNSSDIKDKDKLTSYRKLIEQRMEQFKDIERENKTKPHSKQGLSAEEKLDPREKEKQKLWSGCSAKYDIWKTKPIRPNHKLNLCQQLIKLGRKARGMIQRKARKR
ncbi:hypothetical protein WUBG_10207 [Wuchereria bancrofti]|uniref:CCR4-Not complex component Not N-terminal domain-containing protein n=1 Tax=Wuchereria bancrofti TaxID=6293 RepID=J9E965_WUCBA|nr:hypothetical protein WUBG_10207 [Wuchereria bancrofti]